MPPCTQTTRVCRGTQGVTIASYLQRHAGHPPALRHNAGNAGGNADLQRCHAGVCIQAKAFKAGPKGIYAIKRIQEQCTEGSRVWVRGKLKKGAPKLMLTPARLCRLHAASACLACCNVRTSLYHAELPRLGWCLSAMAF